MSHEDSPPLAAGMPAIADTMLPPPDSRELPTNPENLKLSEYDTDFIRRLDPEFAQAIKVMAALGRDIVKDRDERRELAEKSALNQARIITQQEEIIAILERTEKTAASNYELMREAVRTVQASNSAQAAQLQHHDELLARIDRRVAALEQAAHVTSEAPPTTQ